ncbi:MAG: PEBP family protein [Pseudomonadota bacterium]
MKKIVAQLCALLALTGMARAETIEADVWADNWFAFYLNGQLVAEDSVPITTERSFNAESFRFDAPQKPYVLAFMAKDFKENDTGLEYIGSRRQQMGDGGFIAQFQSGGQTIAATGSGWKCLVVHEAPTDKMCERERNPVAGQGSCGFVVTAEPAGWNSVGFDDSAWPSATEHAARAVGPKDGYDRIRWVSDAKIIWGPDLETNNTVLCRLEMR